MESKPPPDDKRETIKEGRIFTPLRNLFLVDLLADPTSKLVLTWAAGTLLLGMFAYHWLEGWSYLDSL